VFHHDACAGEDPVEQPLTDTQLSTFGLFLGC
jgi:hypothetical protein